MEEDECKIEFQYSVKIVDENLSPIFGCCYEN